MKILIFYSVGMFLCSAVISAVTDNVYLAAVSNSNIAEIVYRRIRKQNPYLRNPPSIQPETKMRLCHHITGSTLFTHVWKENQIFMHEWFEILRDQYSYAFANLYEPEGEYKVYTNETRQVDVYITKKNRHSLDEFVFTCLSVKLDDGDGKLGVYSYSISAEYNLSDLPGTYIPGRFIFYHVDDDRNRREVYALAERPAKSMFAPGSAVEWEYVRRRAGRTIAGEEKDSICRLSKFARLRLCTTILTSTYFQGEIKFAPTLDYIDETACTKRTVYLEDDEVRQSVSGYEYEELMIGCRPQQYCTGSQSEFYVARGYGSPDEVFLFRTRSSYSSTIVIENLFEDVRSTV